MVKKRIDETLELILNKINGLFEEVERKNKEIDQLKQIIKDTREDLEGVIHENRFLKLKIDRIEFMPQ